MADLLPLIQAEKPITLIPVGLKEAALDSPTFRSSYTHFTEQLELVEKWLEGYIKCINKLSQEVGPFESLMTGFLGQTIPPTHVSEAMLDHDYTLLAMKRYGEGAKEFWTATIAGLKRMETNMVQPIKAFLQNDLRPFRETRRAFEQSQKQLDSLQSRYSAQTKAKEASSLREDAFQLHEARKTYLKASMDYSVAAPQLRMALDKMLVRVFADQWRDMRTPQQKISSSIGKWASEIERVKGWSREMETGDRAFQRELQNARRQIEESAEAAARPSRELEDYDVGVGSTPAPKGPTAKNLPTPSIKPQIVQSDRQGWLNIRTVSGKPSRTVWLRRWFYVKNGIFGWLVQGSRSGGVEESERIGVLLCNIKSSNSDDRRCIFEVKTKDTTIILQAETQSELNGWLAAFDMAKRKALEDPASTESPGIGPQPQDPAFAISPPSAPEFAASAADSGMPQHADEGLVGSGVDRSSTLPVPGSDLPINRSSFDIAGHRRPGVDKDTDTSRDPASRIIQKLDLHRKSADRQVSGSVASPGLSGGGIASLIAASHSSMPVGPGALPTPPPPETPAVRRPNVPIFSIRDLPASTLAPNTLASPPAPTNLSTTAVIVNGEKGIGVGRTDRSGGMPGGIMANIWGSSNWGHLNRLARGELRAPHDPPFKLSNPPSPVTRPLYSEYVADSPPKVALSSGSDDSFPRIYDPDNSPAKSKAPSPHRKTASLDTHDKARLDPPKFPSYYPLQLKTQDAQFRLLFPTVRPDEKLVMVFKATWNPNDQQEFPGRVYVTVKEMYFYSNHYGMTLITSIGLDSIFEITAATGRDCDFVFCHLKERENHSGHNRITIKTFLEPLNLLRRRLSFLVHDSIFKEIPIEEIMRTLIRMEHDDPETSSSADSWDNVSIHTPFDGDTHSRPRVNAKGDRDLKTNVLVDRGLYGVNSMQLDGMNESNRTFKLPKQPVIYIPVGMDRVVVEREFNVSPKALFHVMFGDKSAVWQLLYHERQAQHIKQGPWMQPENGHLRRDFTYEIEYLDILRRTRHARIEDHQMIDVANEHLLYVVSDRKSPWHLPYRNDFVLLTKIVITHLAKSKCKLAVYTKVDWVATPPYAQKIIAGVALGDLELDALDLTDVIGEQVRNFASANGRTKKAIQIFGHIGAQTQISEFTGSDAPMKTQIRRLMKSRTLTALAFESFTSMMESIVTSGCQLMLKMIKWIWNTVSANNVILVFLGISILINVISSSFGTSEWWKERKAGNFMARIGIGPNLSMSKLIYIDDLDEAMAPDIGSLVISETQCRDTFNDIMNIARTNSLAQPSDPRPRRNTAAYRLQQSRNHLSSQRHELLVAMRVVNSIEREVIQAEWESWLLEENARCDQLGAHIRHNSTDPSIGKDNTRQEMVETDSVRLQELRKWHEGYCKSCKKDQMLIGI